MDCFMSESARNRGSNIDKFRWGYFEEQCDA